MAKPVDFNNPSNYKKCYKKQYEIHMCMPPKDTVVINKLEHADVVKMLNGKTYFTVDEVAKLKASGDNRFNLIAQALQAGKADVVSDDRPFVCAGTCGELYCRSSFVITYGYTFIKDNQPYPINENILKERLRNSQYLDWTIIRPKPDNQVYFACFVPLSQKAVIQFSDGNSSINAPGVQHGKGDFVVSCSKYGQPDLGHREVTNGLVFANTYNNQGWGDCIDSRAVSAPNITIDSLPRLIPNAGVASFDFKSIYEQMSKIKLQGSIEVGDILETVYEKLDSNTVKNKAKLCREVVKNAGTAFGSATINYCKYMCNRNNDCGEMYEKEAIACGRDFIKNVVPKDLIQSAVASCQGSNNDYPLAFLRKLSSIVMSNADISLFCDEENPYLESLWKQADSRHIIVGADCGYSMTFAQSNCDINKDRVCIDMYFSRHQDAFVRFIYYRTGAVGIKFLPKNTPIERTSGEYDKEKVFCNDTRVVNFVALCNMMCLYCYKQLLGVPKLDTYFETEHTPIIARVGRNVSFYFTVINLANANDCGVISKNKDVYKFKLMIDKEERTVFLKDTLQGIAVRCNFNNTSFDKTYKLSIERNGCITSMLIFSDLCKVFKIHPSKTLLKSRRVWNIIADRVNENISKVGSNVYETQENAGRVRICKIEPCAINLLDTKYEVRVKFYSQGNTVLGERTLVVDFNYDNFDISHTRSRNFKFLRTLQDYKISDYVVTLHYKYSKLSDTGHKNDNVITSINIADMASAVGDTVLKDDNIITPINIDDIASAVGDITLRIGQEYNKYR